MSHVRRGAADALTKSALPRGTVPLLHEIPGLPERPILQMLRVTQHAARAEEAHGAIDLTIPEVTMQDGVGRIHHVTAIAGSAQRNLDFYAGLLGLRLIKKTVNFDDPYTYHLYYGDERGRPGTLLTFFPWEGTPRGQRGTGQAASVALSITEASLGYWLGRLSAYNLRFTREERFNEPVIAFEDPDGLRLELVAHTGTGPPSPSRRGPVDAEHALRGIRGVTIWEDEPDRTAALLTERLGYRDVGEESGTYRYEHGSGGPGARIDIRRAEGFWPGVPGAGTVHHVAFRAEDEAAQHRIHARLTEDGLSPTPIIDRRYFRSIYFREPGGVLFEIATDPPGFTVDEAYEELGNGLKLPLQYEAMRELLEAVLPPLHRPDGDHGPEMHP